MIFLPSRVRLSPAKKTWSTDLRRRLASTFALRQGIHELLVTVIGGANTAQLDVASGEVLTHYPSVCRATNARSIWEITEAVLMKRSTTCKPARVWPILFAFALGAFGTLGPAALALRALPTTLRPARASRTSSRPPGFSFEVWTNIAGASVSDLTENPRYQTNALDIRALATAADTRTVFADDSHETYGGRLSGFLVPKESGSYELFLRSDAASQLLSESG